MSLYAGLAGLLDPEARRALLDVAALDYDAAGGGGLERVATYHAIDGIRHDVAINLHSELDWRVLDISAAGEAILVERLPGCDDRRAQAEALARDYIAQCRAYARGLRPDPPILRPAQMHMRPDPASPPGR